MYQVYVRFTVVAACKEGGPKSCEDQMRLCDAQFALNGTDVNDDICKCEALPDIQFGLEPDDKIGVDGKRPATEKNPTKSETEKALTKGEKPHIVQEENKKDKDAKANLDDKSIQYEVVKESNPKNEKLTDSLKDKPVLTRIGDNRRDANPVSNGKGSTKDNEPLNSIELLLFIQNAVDAVNDASHGKLLMTLSKISNIHHSDHSGTYSLGVVCGQPSGETQKCNITCKPQPGLKEQALLVDYICKPLTTAPVVKSPAPAVNNLPASNKPPSHQVTLIAEYAAIQMDIIDTDDYRRVVLQVTSVRESLTTDGNSLVYSLSVIMVSTSCKETTRIQDQDSQSCLDQLMSLPQQCNIDCSRSCMSDEPPTLVSSQCDPLLEDERWVK